MSAENNKDYNVILEEFKALWGKVEDSYQDTQKQETIDVSSQTIDRAAKVCNISFLDANYTLYYPIEDTVATDECKTTHTFYEYADMLSYLRGLGLKGVYLDCGGYVGNHAIFFSNHTYATKVFSFEQNTHLYYFLNYNTNSYPKITTLNKGVGEISEQSAYTTTIDEEIPKYLTKEDRVAFIKLDIEGGEFKALKGAKQVINRHKPVIYTEILRGIDVFKDVHNVLKSYGYELLNSFGQHYFWYYRDVYPNIKEDVVKFEAYNKFVATTKKKNLLLNYLSKISTKEKVYITNDLSKEGILDLVNICLANITELRGFGYTDNTLQLDSCVRTLTKEGLLTNVHVYLSPFIEGLSLYQNRTVDIIDLLIQNNEQISELFVYIDTILTLFNEGGLLVLTFDNLRIQDKDMQTKLFEYLDEHYAIQPYSIHRNRYTYSKGEDNLLTTYYIYL